MPHVGLVAWLLGFAVLVAIVAGGATAIALTQTVLSSSGTIGGTVVGSIPGTIANFNEARGIAEAHGNGTPAPSATGP